MYSSKKNIREVEFQRVRVRVQVLGESPKFLVHYVINFCLYKISTRSHNVWSGVYT